MLKKIFAIAILMSTPLFSTDMEITEPELSGECKDDDITVVSENGKNYIAAYFSNMTATTESKLYEKKRCTMKYNLKLPKDKKIALFQLSIDGIYQLADGGTARLTVSHRSSNDKSARVTKFFSEENGDPKSGDIHDHTGIIKKEDISEEYRKCGAEIPLTTSLYASASKPSKDADGLTLIDLDEGVSSGATNICIIKTDDCDD